MKSQASRSRFFILLFVMLLSQVMCNMPMKEDESVELAGELLGLEIGEGLVYEVAAQVNDQNNPQEEWCSEYDIPQPNRIESFEFGKGTQKGALTVITPGGEIKYGKLMDKDNTYCRTVLPRGMECIEFVGGNQYELSLDVFPDSTNSELKNCYRAVHTLTLTNEDMVSNNIADDVAGEAPQPEVSVPQPDAGDLQPDANACNATQHLFVTSEITHQEVNKYNTRICKYKLAIHNNADETVWFYLHIHEKDSYQQTEDFRWMGNFPIEPGQNFPEWVGNIAIYNEEDFSGPVMHIPERLAGVYGSPECAEFKMNETFLEQISIPISSECPLE
jgi:hypothetical protein